MLQKKRKSCGFSWSLVSLDNNFVGHTQRSHFAHCLIPSHYSPLKPLFAYPPICLPAFVGFIGFYGSEWVSVWERKRKRGGSLDIGKESSHLVMFAHLLLWDLLAFMRVCERERGREKVDDYWTVRSGGEWLAICSLPIWWCSLIVQLITCWINLGKCDVDIWYGMVWMIRGRRYSFSFLPFFSVGWFS